MVSIIINWIYLHSKYQVCDNNNDNDYDNDIDNITTIQELIFFNFILAYKVFIQKDKQVYYFYYKLSYIY